MKTLLFLQCIVVAVLLLFAVGCDDESRSSGGGDAADDAEDDASVECDAGFAGDHCLTNVDDCSEDACENGGTCVDEVNGFSCDCVEGTSGDTCELNVDDCTPEPCLFDGECTDGIHDYSCECAAGFSGDNCESNDNAELTTLSIVNQVDDEDDPASLTIVIIQKNSQSDDAPVAWRVIEVAKGATEVFRLPAWTTAAVAYPSGGAPSSRMSVGNGQKLTPIEATTETRLAVDGASSSGDRFEIENNLGADPLDAFIYRDGHLLAKTTALADGETAAFTFNPSFYVGADLPAPALAEGDVLSEDQVAAINTQTSILGIASADLVIDGSPGSYNFTLQNTVYH